MLGTVSGVSQALSCANLHGYRLQALSVADLLFCRQAEEDGLVNLLRLVLVGRQALLWCLLLLFLDMLLHVRNERLRRALDLRRIKLVGCTIRGFGGERRLGRLLGLLSQGLGFGHCCCDMFAMFLVAGNSGLDPGLNFPTFCRSYGFSERPRLMRGCLIESGRRMGIFNQSSRRSISKHTTGCSSLHCHQPSNINFTSRSHAVSRFISSASVVRTRRGTCAVITGGNG